jgi:transposase-like protein
MCSIFWCNHSAVDRCQENLTQVAAMATYVPRAFITDELGNHAAAMTKVVPDVEHVRDKRSNNRGEFTPANTKTKTPHVGRHADRIRSAVSRNL